MIEQFWSEDFVAVLTKIELVNNLGNYRQVRKKTEVGKKLWEFSTGVESEIEGEMSEFGLASTLRPTPNLSMHFQPVL